MNVFVVSGHVPIIAASIVAKAYYPLEVNILIHEVGHNKMVHARFASPSSDYHDISSILASFFLWDDVITIHPVYNQHGNAEGRWFDKLFRKMPILKFLTGLDDLRSLKNDVKRKIPKLESKDRLIVSDNTVSWRLCFRGECALHMLEHGASSYRVNYAAIPIYKAIKRKIYTWLTGYNFHCVPQTMYLTDGGESHLAFVHHLDPKAFVQIESVNCKKYIQEMFTYFEVEYSKRYSEDYREICHFKDTIKDYDNVYIYMPSEIVPMDDYQGYLAEQLLQVDTNRSVFIIKNHPRDKAEYADFFRRNACASLMFTSLKNRYIPIEILLFLFKGSILFGNYSSSFLYANWWMHCDFVIARVSNIHYLNIQDALNKEYSGVLEDFKRMGNKGFSSEVENENSSC